MLETFKARLKAKSTAAGAKSLTNERLDAMSAKLNAKFPDLKDEAEHDAKIDDIYDADMFKEMQSFDDYQKGKTAKEKADREKTEKEAEKKAAEEGKNDDTPDWKSLTESVKTLSEKLAKMESEKIHGTIKSKAEALLKEVPVSYWGKRALPGKEDDLQAFIAEVTADYTEFKQELVNQGLSVHTAPPAAGGGQQKTGAVSPEVKAFIDKKKEQQQKEKIT